jgi:probable H4MPT-linked C1 transfer pathway protein
LDPRLEAPDRLIDREGRAGGRTIGWDLGGVHVKAALVIDGRIMSVVQAPCALWRGVQALDEALDTLPDWARQEARHSVTMTGELCDAFADRREGVDALSSWAASRLNGTVVIYGGRRGFLSPAAAKEAALDVASANWHATARLVGRHLTEALLVDIGSTTSDLIAIRGGVPRARGYSDAERLRTGELVYAGAVRTPLMALAVEIPFRGVPIGLMAETFASTADVYRLLSLLPPEADQQSTFDGRGKSIEETETRLARMVGHDRMDASSEDWRQLATAFAEAQLARLAQAAMRIINAGGLPLQAPVVGCGVGRFIAASLAARLDRPYIDLAELMAAGEDRDWISSCAPAVAVALLASH